ncbi:MAG: excinuclease ABC subunit UvrB [Candidatus Aminicenantes bacterium]|nr:excinuclease ABC subunit UvrB [Candidatus Aminicenantes bacterium]
MFNLVSPYRITAAQKAAVDEIVSKFKEGCPKQVLLGVTGSGKTFAMAHIIRALDVPTLVLSPNKTLAAQLFQEFKGFFPSDRVGYFISYYDYYQPEAFVPQRNLYIAKEVSINPELERLRLDATRNLLESRQTVLVASVSSIYSIGSPADFSEQKITLAQGDSLSRDDLLNQFVTLGYNRTHDLLESGKFRVRGQMVELFPTSEENPLRFVFSGSILKQIGFFDPLTAECLEDRKQVNVFPINYFFYRQSRIDEALVKIRTELEERLLFFQSQAKPDLAERLRQRTLFDIEMLEQFGHCPGIENYSRHLTDRQQGEAPYTLLSFFPSGYLTIIDESHVTVPQLNGMYAGDRSRKNKLVEYGFRLPSALDNRPLNFAEIQERLQKVLYVSATPSEFEVADARGQVTSLLVRPTGLIDPQVIVKKADDPVQDMLGEIEPVIKGKNRVLITTLTKKMSEKLADFLILKGIRCAYLHSEIKALDRVKIIRKLRQGEFDVLIGINLLREGLDLPEVALVVILDADKEGFLRSATALIQTFGRAARNIDGKVILYADSMVKSVQKAIAEAERRRNYQIEYNRNHSISPVSVRSPIKDFHDDDYWLKKSEEPLPANFKNRETLEKEIEKLTATMKKKAAGLDFKSAAQLRDRIKLLKNMLIEMF